MAVAWHIEAVEPHRRFAFRRHPYGVEEAVDVFAEPTTLVEFMPEETADGVLLRIVESGFDAPPAERRASAYESNSQSWAAQVERMRKYLGISETV